MLSVILKKTFFKNTELIYSLILLLANVTFIKKNIKQEFIVKRKN